MKGVMMTKDIDENTLGLSEKEKAFLKAEEERMGMKLKELVSPPVYNMCFACGSANPIGLHLHFFAIPDGCISFFTPRREHQSYNDRMHGGLIMTLMDEVMGKLLISDRRRPRLYRQDGIPFPLPYPHRRDGRDPLP